jgi:hypothetical protein
MFIINIGRQIINISMNSKFFLASVTVITAGYTTSTYLLKDRDIQLKNIKKDRDIQLKNIERDRDIQIKDRECLMKERIAQLKYNYINTTNNK